MIEIEMTAEKLEAFVKSRYQTASAHPEYWDSNFSQAFGAWTLFTDALFEAGRVGEANRLGVVWANKWYNKFLNIRHELLGIELLEVIE